MSNSAVNSTKTPDYITAMSCRSCGYVNGIKNSTLTTTGNKTFVNNSPCYIKIHYLNPNKIIAYCIEHLCTLFW